MAYEQINRYVDRLAERYNKLYEKDYSKAVEVLMCILDFHDTVLQNPKFKFQKRYCKDMIYHLNLAFANGYFKTNKTHENE
jgi:hypothetical protein